MSSWDLIKAVVQACPASTQDLKLNTENRNKAINSDHIQYGPLNLDDELFWSRIAQFWKTTPEIAEKSRCGNCSAFDLSARMEACMPGKTSDDDGELGFCWMHKFKCHSARTCRTWVKGGPIKSDKVSKDWERRAGDKNE